jgi:hypothetical protein
MTQPTAPISGPFNVPSYGAGSMVIDKAGTIFQVWTGRLTNPGAWGSRIYRTVKGGKPELVWFIEDANTGALIIMNKQLFLPYQPPKGRQQLQQIHGYIDPSDEPSSAVVNVDESALNSVKQSLAVMQAGITQADYKATSAQSIAKNLQVTNAKLESNLAALQAQVASLQSRLSTLQSAGPGQVADIVWAKLWDSIYLIRMAMNSGNSTDSNIQGFLVDLTSFIKKVGK